MLMISSILDVHLKMLQHNLEDQEFSKYRQKTGELMGVIYTEILRPLWAQYPELLPKQMEGGQYVVDEQMYQDLIQVLQKYAATNV